jgi:hypothetical protein
VEQCGRGPLGVPGAGGRFRQRRTRLNGQRGYASLVVIVAVLVLAACYSTMEVSTTGRPDPTPARRIAGAAHVLDGATIDIAGERIRLRGIDAAEDGQRCGLPGGGTWDCAGAATARLQALTAGSTTTCDPIDRDRFGRIVAVCRMGDIDVQEVLTRERPGVGLPAIQPRLGRSRRGSSRGGDRHLAGARGAALGVASSPTAAGGDGLEQHHARRLQHQGKHQ